MRDNSVDQIRRQLAGLRQRPTNNTGYISIEDVSNELLALELSLRLFKRTSLRSPLAFSDFVELDNLTLARIVANELGRPLRYEIVNCGNARPGHDLRYALDGAKLARLGWRLPNPLDIALRRTIRWYRDNPSWLS